MANPFEHERLWENADLWTQKDQYVLIKTDSVAQYNIIDVRNRGFILIEDLQLALQIIDKMLENGCRIYNDILEAFRENPENPTFERDFSLYK